MVLAAYLATAFVVGATGAYHLLRGRQGPMVRTMFSMAMWMAAIVAPLQAFVGDQHGLNTFEHQPAKVAAMEGHFEAEQKGAPLILFGLPDMQAGETRYAISNCRSSAACILTHDLDGTVKGLKSWPREDWPRVPIVFWSFRIMVGLGLLMIATGLVSLWLQMARKALRDAALRALVPADGAVRLRRAPRRLVRHRDGASALHRLRPAPDRRLRLADRRAGRRAVADRVRRRLSDRVRDGRLVPAASDARRSGSAVGERRRKCRSAPPASRRSQATHGAGRRGRERHDRPRRSSGRRSSPSRSTPMSCSTGSISASASSCPSPGPRRGRGDDDLRHRAGLGRQRDLAGARRRRAAWRPFRSPIRSCFRRSMRRSSRCCSR